MTEKRSPTVTITDVTLREYGQNIPGTCLSVFNPEIRVNIARKLIEAGFSNLEILSCIHPRIAPAMERGALKDVVSALGRRGGIHLITLVPNRAGYDTFRSLDLGPKGYNHTMGIFFSAVEAHNLANLGRPLKETVQEYKGVMKDASSEDIRIVGYVSAAFGYVDPKEDLVIKADLDEVNTYIDLFFDLGARAVTLSDLQGVADEGETSRVLQTILDKRKGRDIHRLGYHPHHVSGEKALANSKVAYDLGIRRFDSSLGGTGGCVTGAPGNQPTEGLVRLFHDLGAMTGLDEKKIFALADTLQKELYSKIPLSRGPHHRE
jgi:hydroxymethylglutaryl-CoA lyase